MKKLDNIFYKLKEDSVIEDNIIYNESKQMELDDDTVKFLSTKPKFKSLKDMPELLNYDEASPEVQKVAENLELCLKKGFISKIYKVRKSNGKTSVNFKSVLPGDDVNV